MRRAWRALGAMLGVGLLGLPAVAPVAAQAESAGEQLVVSVWSLVEMDGRSVPRDAGISMTFWPSGRLSGSSGCNVFESTWLWFRPARLEVGPISTSRRTCRAPVMRREQRFLELLWAPETSSIDDDRLAVVTDGGQSLVFDRGAQAPGVLFGRWRLVSIDGQPLSDGIEADAVFAEDGPITGTAGCNAFTAPYDLDGPAIRTGPVTAQRVPCRGDARRVEAAYLAALEAASRWSVRGDILVLRSGRGEHTLEFAAVRPVIFGAVTDAGWRLVRWDDAEVPATTAMSAIFTASGTVGGSTGCNDFTGTYSVDGATFLLDGLTITTGRTCPSPHMDNEAAYLNVLSSAVAWKLPDNQLQLTTADGMRLVFDGVAAVDGVPSAQAVVTDAITGVVWTLADVIGTDVSGLPPVTLVLLADGTISGVSGCDLYGATWAVEGESLRIRDAGTGDRQCDDDVMALQRSYLAMLPLVDGAHLEGGQLVLTASAAGEVLRFAER